MKIYATTTTERASKGQGGNDHLLIVITAEIDKQRQEIASLSVVNTENYYAFAAIMPDGEHITAKVSKAKKQKGETLSARQLMEKSAIDVGLIT